MHSKKNSCQNRVNVLLWLSATYSQLLVHSFNPYYIHVLLTKIPLVLITI